uniref:Apoptotic protease-activating factor 1 n=1 Tax=Callorhinchus milii TaxID=7868 RepID=A0A4W3JJF3_CALMI
MEERTRSCLLRHRSALEQDIKTSYIMDHLISEDVLTVVDEQKVKAKTTQRERAALLLDMVLEKDNYGFMSFYNALLNEGYKDLAALLQDDIPVTSPPTIKSFVDGVTPYVQTMLCEGGVPQRPVVFVDRPKLVQTIRKELIKLKQGPGWITIHGMAGSGKSVLAAEALRNHSVIDDCFPGGVHWVSIGKQDRVGLLVKLQNLCSRLDQESQIYPNPPLNMDEARDRLRFLMARKHPRSLLILDDVWESWVLKCFDIHSRVLITSRDKSVTDTVAGNKSLVPVQSGLTGDKGLEVLARFVNLEVSSLPQEAYNIVQECKGSPLVVSLIGALLREFPNRWEYYLKQLQNKQFKRIRKSSSYDYEALDEAMAISIDVLEEYQKEHYKDLSVLKKDVKVPTKVLCVLWEKDTEEVEDILQLFVNKSLLFCDRNGKSFQYYLHDLQLDFLTEQNRNRLPELHAKMVRQYQKVHEKHFPLPSDEDCMYWYSFLIGHMAEALMHKELYLLMFSMDWIKAKTELMGPAPLINDFVEYRHILDKENSTVRDNFQEFLSLKGHLLVQKPFPDIVQLGLCQPDCSEVYRQARLEAGKTTKDRVVYLEWMNKNLQSLTRLVVRPHSDAVLHGCFSPDGQRIATCGVDKNFQVFKSTTGEKVLEVAAHDDDVLCCVFSPDNKFIATCSSDTKVKVWNSVTGELLQTYSDHTEQVNHCQFSNLVQTNLLATCSNDTYLKTWDLKGKSCKNTLFGHDNSVNHCNFSPDDKYLASCSNDGTVKLWDVSSANEWKFFDVKNEFMNTDDNQEKEEVLVKCCTWSSDGSQLIAATKNILFIFNVATGDIEAKLESRCHSTIQYCHASPISSLVAVALSHYSVELWDIKLQKRVADCSGHLSWVHCVQFSPDGSMLLSSSDDQTVRLWETNKVHHTSSISLMQVMDVVFEQNEVVVLVADSKNCLQLINGKTGDVMCQTEVQESRICCCCLSLDLNLAAFGRGDGILKAGVKSAKLILQSFGWKTQPSQQSPLVAIGLENGTVKVLDRHSGRVLHMLNKHTKCVQRCQFTSDGETLISSSDDTTLLVWNWRAGEYKVLKGHIEQVKNFKVLDDSQLLSWSFDGTMKIWNFSRTAPLYVLTGHKACVRSCRFSKDNEYLATGDDNGEIRIWRVRDGCLLHVCPKESEDSKHGGWVTDLHFSPNSKMLISTGGYIKWWDLENGEFLQTFYTNGTNLKVIYVSADFQTFVTIDNIGTLYVLKMIERWGGKKDSCDLQM